MKVHKDGKVEMEEGEPIFRSCWECNSAHEHLKEAQYIHLCFACGRYFINGRFLSEFKTDKELKQFLELTQNTTKEKE